MLLAMDRLVVPEPGQETAVSRSSLLALAYFFSLTSGVLSATPCAVR